MKIRVNNKEIETAAQTLAQLAAELQLPEKGVAVAVGNAIVPRGAWSETPLDETKDILIIKAFAGG
ncbi:MAG: sulfur carrier protein ThiS [Bacteroidales bacterium]|nr:sulfur carrier protein ThiS [Bacteroidales bacterium]